MKRFFYGALAAGLLLASGCGGDKSAKTESQEMTPAELARAEEEAVKELAKIIAEEAADMPIAAMDDEFSAFDYESLTEQEKAQLLAWEQEAEQWAREQLAQGDGADMLTADADFDANMFDERAMESAQADAADSSEAPVAA